MKFNVNMGQEEKEEKSCWEGQGDGSVTTQTLALRSPMLTKKKLGTALCVYDINSAQTETG